MREITKIKHRRSKNRREQVTNLQQPAQKRRRTTTQTKKYIRVMQQENTGGKRKENTQVENMETNKRTKHVENTDKLENKEHTPPPKMKGKNWEEDTEERWKKYLMERELEIEEEERTTRERKEKAAKLEKGWELFKLCKEMLEKEGNKWEMSKERRWAENNEKIEREERLQRGREKREKLIGEIENRKTQQRITDMLRQLPENRRTVLEMELEKERKLSLQEAKMELWRTRRNSKQTKLDYLTSKRKGAENKEELDHKLRRIEEELTKSKAEAEKREREQAIIGEKKKKAQALREKRKHHWEMMTWLTNFLDNNQEKWRIRRVDQEKQRAAQEKREQWEKKSMESRREQFLLEERKQKERMKPAELKEKRLEKALELKRNWKANWRTWRKESEGEQDTENSEWMPPSSLNCTDGQPLLQTPTPSKFNNLPPPKLSQRPPSKTGGAGEQPEPLPPTITNLTPLSKLSQRPPKQVK